MTYIARVILDAVSQIISNLNDLLLVFTFIYLTLGVSLCSSYLTYRYRDETTVS
jgi:ABC-type polysaccharide/polyol phosphate export permease